MLRQQHPKRKASVLYWCFSFWMQQLPIFPCRLQQSIVGASELNFCVRYENRWILTAIVTAMVYIQVSLYISSLRVNLVYSFFRPLSISLHSSLTTAQKFFPLKLFVPLSPWLISIQLRFVFLIKFASLSFLRSSPRPISIGQLNTSLYLHPRPIKLVVFKWSYYLSIWDILS